MKPDLADRVRPSQAKILSWSSLCGAGANHKAAGKKVVWTNGCFDLLHAGHVLNLQAARAFGDVLIVGVNGDSSVRALKGANRPIVGERERALMVAALECVDYVTVLDTLTWDRQLAELAPDIYCKGSEYSSGPRSSEAAAVEAYGGRIEYLPMIGGVSTTLLMERIRQQSGGEAMARLDEQT
jgi:D-beta-D-heptose 7-phosphate kinase/D-beta-D-heptose 1-phosphate adenosyltransferase